MKNIEDKFEEFEQGTLKINQRMDQIEETMNFIEKDVFQIKKDIHEINNNIFRLNQAIGFLQLQSAMPQPFPTYEPETWREVGGNCYNYAANDRLYNWKLHVKGAPTPGFTKGKSYTNEDPWKKVAFGLHFDSRGRGQLLYDIDSHDLKVPKVRQDGYHILYFATTKDSLLQGFHFAREDKNLDGTRQGWSHRDASWILPEK